jgi:hypothetical protein
MDRSVRLLEFVLFHTIQVVPSQKLKFRWSNWRLPHPGRPLASKATLKVPGAQQLVYRPPIGDLQD